MTTRTTEQKALLNQVKQIADGLSQTFAPFCEVVVHDLLDPQHAILAIHNNLSGREVGDPVTELGLARISDMRYPQVIANYANQFPDGRQAKSTSIGIKDASGKYVAALCMNVDLTLFHGMQSALALFGNVDAGVRVHESLDSQGTAGIRERVYEFAARCATSPRSLKAEERRALIRELKEAGCLDVRRAAETIAQLVGVSRATVYNDAK